MAVKKPARPVKPIPAEQVKPAGAWSLERFSEQATRKALELDEQVLAEMRAKLRPQLEAEIAQIRAEAEAAAREEGYQAGYAAGEKAGYDAGYQAGMAAAQADIQRLKEAVEALLGALERPLDAWDDAVMQLIAQTVRESLRRFLVSDVDARIRLMHAQLSPVLSQMQAEHASVTIVAHPDVLTRLRQLLDVEADWRADPDVSPTQVQVRQAVSEVVLDWQSMLEHYLADLEQALRTPSHDTPTDTSTDPTA